MHVLDTPFEPSTQKRKRFASVTSLLPTKTKRKHHIGAINQIFHAAMDFKFFSLRAFKKIKRKKRNKGPLLKIRKGQSKQKIGRKKKRKKYIKYLESLESVAGVNLFKNQAIIIQNDI